MENVQESLFYYFWLFSAPTFRGTYKEPLGTTPLWLFFLIFFVKHFLPYY